MSDDRKKYQKKTGTTVNMQLMDIGKMPPQVTELEEAVLGAMMLEAQIINPVMEILKPQSFYKDSHARIYSAIERLTQRSEPVDPMTVTLELKKTADLDLVGGAFYISQLTNRIASAANTEHHARIVAQKFIQRELIRISTQTINRAYSDEGDVFQMIAAQEKEMTALMHNFRTGSTSKTMVNLWRELEDKNELLRTLKGLNGVPSGFHAIDKTTGGWQKGNLIVIAARPAMGKTALAINMACNAAITFNKPGVIFSMEMSALELFTRMVSSESQVSNNYFNRKSIDPEDLANIGNNVCKLINCDIFIDDTPALTINELKSKARRHMRDHKIEWIVVDYLQLMEGESDYENREQTVAKNSRGLKALAKELELPVIALSQLTRGVVTRGGEKRPELSDLRESGAIEQDADVVMFLHRPEYYNISEDEHGVSTAGVAENIFKKNRNGPLGTVYTRFIDVLTKFVNADDPMEGEIKEPSAIRTADPDAFIVGKNQQDEDHPF